MAAEPPTPLARQLRRAAGLPDPDPPTDGQLLDRFRTGRDEAAFAELVERHGPMVLGVCRRVLRHEADADDAFQAAFLVLLRRAAELAGRETVGNWLYGVAYRTALKARANAVRRRAKEAAAVRAEPADPDGDTGLLDEVLVGLPEKYREPLVLCELEGLCRRDAAARLGVPEGTLSSRMATGKRMLADRLRRRGLAAPATLLAAVPAGLAGATARAAAVAAGYAAGAVPAAVAKLAAEVTRAMFLTKLRFGAIALVGVLLGTAAGVTTLAGPSAGPDDKSAAKQLPEAKAPAKAPAPDAPGTVGPPAPGEPAWKAEFREAYGLADGQALRLVRGDPFPRCRDSFLAAEVYPRNTDRNHMLLTLTADGRRIAHRNVTIGMFGWWKEQTRNGGLGLSGMRERALLVGGELTVHSVPRQGTQVELTIA